MTAETIENPSASPLTLLSEEEQMFQQSVRDFAVVIPVPTKIERGQIHVADKALLDPELGLAWAASQAQIGNKKAAETALEFMSIELTKKPCLARLAERGPKGFRNMVSILIAPPVANVRFCFLKNEIASAASLRSVTTVLLPMPECSNSLIRFSIRKTKSTITNPLQVCC